MMKSNMEQKPLVSVIIPCYNLAPYLPEAIESVLAQTYRPIEVIVVDDGSIDNTSDVVRRYRDQGVKLICQENKGLAAARNAGLKDASGKYVALLDADDAYLPEKIERQVEYLESHPDCGVCYCGIYHYWEDRPGELFLLKYEYYSGENAKKALLKKNFINPLSVVLRRSAVEPIGFFREDFRRSEDWEYWIRLMFGGVKFDFLNVPLARYRMRPLSSLSYNSKDETKRKELQLKIFVDLYERSDVLIRRRYHLYLIMWYHRLKYMVALSEGIFPVVSHLRTWFQKKRLASA